ncbi:MAG: cell division protein SepF [Candidatus Lokiarchaeota archaeon]|nr:cell division protein SepF [Candidatus Lokiarchaeota archaeon]
MARFWKKIDDDLLGAPEETMGFSRELIELKQSFLIKKYDFSSLEQIDEIKKELLGRRILIINAQELLKDVDVTKLKRGIEDLKSFLRENGGSMARLGDQYLILTPNSAVKISN